MGDKVDSGEAAIASIGGGDRFGVFERRRSRASSPRASGTAFAGHSLQFDRYRLYRPEFQISPLADVTGTRRPSPGDQSPKQIIGPPLMCGHARSGPCLWRCASRCECGYGPGAVAGDLVARGALRYEIRNVAKSSWQRPGMPAGFPLTRSLSTTAFLPGTPCTSPRSA